MKRLITIIIVFLSYSCFGTIHYISNAGLVGNTGTSTGSPWPFSKIASITYAPGDQLLFNRGETYYGSITINQSGAAGNPITFGAYGTGAKPIIIGFTTVSAFTNLGSNIWESTAAVSLLATCNMVSVNGVNTAMGRYPNFSAGCLTINSHSGSTSITSSSLTGNWTGADVVIRIFHWQNDRSKITSQSGGTLTFNALTFPSTGTDVPQNGYGFYIENHPGTLDQQNEWYYDPSTKKIRIYSTVSPTNVQVATVDNLVSITGKSYITIDGIDFQGSNKDAVYGVSTSHITVKNCNVSFAGWSGVSISGSSTLADIENNTIADCNGSGIENYDFSSGYTVKNNVINRIGLITGVVYNEFSGAGIRMTSSPAGAVNTVIQSNTVDSCGANGIMFRGANIEVRNNFVNHTSLRRDDGGGLYASGTETGKIIDGNIILNSIGYTPGTNALDKPAIGIYLDDQSTGVTVTNNTIAYSNGSGFLLHTIKNCTLWNNTVYDSRGVDVATGGFDRGAIFILADVAGITTGNVIRNNIFFARDATQYTYFTANKGGTVADVQSYGTFDSNYYASPMGNQSQLIRLFYYPTTATNYYSLSSWKSLIGQDAHSLVSPKLTPSGDSSVFIYNETSAPVTTSLTKNYEDVRGNQYNGSVTVPAYSSVILIQNGPITGTNISPTAHAGVDQTITLPTNTVNLSGSGTDVDGTIASYNWIKISGVGGSFSNSHIANPVFTGGAGLYTLQLQVFDNQGASGTDNIDVTVNPAANIPPVANAGADKSISLPLNSVTLFGSGTDADGSVVSYHWAQVSGTGASINSANTASTTISGLTTAGTRIFSLTVTDNNGATHTDNVSVVVSLDAAPSVNAGTDQSIAITSTTLTAIATPATGHSYTIVWSKISGTGGSISSPGSLSTGVTGLSGGTYQFMVTITQDDGQTASDNITVTVSIPNIAPVANAGSDQGVTLPTSTATLTGSGTDADGSISTYHWTKTSGPSVTIASPNSATTNLTGLTAGVYKFLLTVTDNSGATNSDEVVVTVSSVLGTNLIYIRITRNKKVYK